jgi:hypothetical protein
MLDPIFEFFQRIFDSIKKGIAALIALILWPFVTLMAFFKASGWILKILIAFVVIVIFGGYGFFGWQTQVWSGFNTSYPDNMCLLRLVCLALNWVRIPVPSQMW